MKIEEIMTPYVRCVQSDVALVEAAVVMRDMDVGALPICEGGRLVGVLTDRDIALRAVAEYAGGYRRFWEANLDSLDAYLTHIQQHPEEQQP